MNAIAAEARMRSITPTEFKRMKDAGEAFQLIDVREPYEVEGCTLGGENIPMGDLLQELGRIRKDIPVVVHCHSGRRSAAVVSALEARYGFGNVANLAGGIRAYALEVDPALDPDRSRSDGAA